MPRTRSLVKAFDLIPVVEQVLPDRQKTEVSRPNLGQPAGFAHLPYPKIIRKGHRIINYMGQLVLIHSYSRMKVEGAVWLCLCVLGMIT